MTLDSIRKAKSPEIREILLPHYGVVSGREAQEYLAQGEKVAQGLSQLILKLLSEGKGTEEIFAHMTELVYTEQVRPAYPYEAYKLISHIMIELVRKELFLPLQEC